PGEVQLPLPDDRGPASRPIHHAQGWRAVHALGVGAAVNDLVPSHRIEHALAFCQQAGERLPRCWRAAATAALRKAGWSVSKTNPPDDRALTLAFALHINNLVGYNVLTQQKEL